MSDDRPVYPTSKCWRPGGNCPKCGTLPVAHGATDFQLVGAFHRKFLINTFDDTLAPHPISKDVELFRLRFLTEELQELEEAMNANDLPGIADALIDLVYVALGTAHYYNFDWDRLFDAVHASNMLKERALDHPYQVVGTCCDQPQCLHSKRGSTLDVVKPPGWKSPDIAGILEANGWEKDK